MQYYGLFTGVYTSWVVFYQYEVNTNNMFMLSYYVYSLTFDIIHDSLYYIVATLLEDHSNQDPKPNGKLMIHTLTFLPGNFLMLHYTLIDQRNRVLL